MNKITLITLFLGANAYGAGVQLQPIVCHQPTLMKSFERAIRGDWFDRVQGIVCSHYDLLSAPIDDAGNSALHIAACSLNYPIAQYLIMSGANVNARNNYGTTPLMELLCCSTINRAYHMTKLLLEHHTDVSLETDRGHTAPYLARCSRWIDKDYSEIEGIKELLGQYEAAAAKKAKEEQEGKA